MDQRWRHIARRITPARLRRRISSAIAPRRDAPAERDPRTALVENGFYVARQLIPPSECAWIARTLKHEAKITNGKHARSLDSVNRLPSARAILFDGRLLGAVERAIGTKPRFLQISALQYFHDTAAWHRDGMSREDDSSSSPDWSDTSAPYRVVKAIVYLESDGAGMGMMAASHRSPIEMDAERVAAIEKRGEQVIVGPSDDPNRSYTDDERTRPLVWVARPGDVLIFDERMYHCGRRLRDGHVTQEMDAQKFTMAFVFGGDDNHSARMYSYFRFARTELSYRPFGDRLANQLKARGLVHSAGWTNYFARHPDELDHVHLKDPSQREELKRQFQSSNLGGD